MENYYLEMLQTHVESVHLTRETNKSRNKITTAVLVPEYYVTFSRMAPYSLCRKR
jgi:hypothetical protein